MERRDEANPRRDFAASVVARLREAGFEAYWAGGCVRDILLGLEPADYDVATNARPEQVASLFRRTVGVGVSFGVVMVLGPRGAGEVEVATFRSDGAYVDGRRPESVVFSTAESDASRRDFTINGMFLDPETGRVIDSVGGRDDLERRVLRAIGDPAARFAEDKLRLLRAVRFAARFGLAIDPATRRAVESMASQVTTVSVERIAQELRRMLVHSTRAEAMRMAREVGLVAAILPALDADEGRWDEMMRVLEHLPEAPGFPLAFAALLGEVGRDVAVGLVASFKLSNAERDRIAWLAENRRTLDDPAGLPRHRLKRLLASDGIHDLIALRRAEAMANDADLSAVVYCEDYLRTEPDGPINPPPLLTGHDLARHGLRPGPRFATLLEAARDAQLDGLITTQEEALALVDRLMALTHP
jgi:poly(A) polymerase